jgi:hypothetical protein
MNGLQVQMLMDQGIFQMSVIEANLNLPRYQIRSAISPDLAAKIVRTSHQKKLWTDERIMDSIRQASDGVAMLSTKQYADAIKSGKKKEICKSKNVNKSTCINLRIIIFNYLIRSVYL